MVEETGCFRGMGANCIRLVQPPYLVLLQEGVLAVHWEEVLGVQHLDDLL